MSELLGAPLSVVQRAPGQQAVQPNFSIDEAPEEILRVAREFEAVFLAEMLSPMFDALDTDGLGGGGAGEQMFRPMLVEQYAESIARNGGVGIADSVVREFMRMQGAIMPEDADGASG
jgi:flagellar protein FlgJ